MMKKTLLSAVLLGIVAASGAQAAPGQESVPVNFFGEVKDPTCKVTVGQSGNKINLGILKPTGDQSQGAIVPVVFNFDQCSGGTLQKIEFAGGQNGGTDNWQQGVVGTNRKNVQIKLYNDASGTGSRFTNSLQLNKPNLDQAGKFTVTAFYAALQKVDQQQDAEAGAVDAAALFTVTYL